MMPVGFSSGSHNRRWCSSACSGTATWVTAQCLRSLAVSAGRVQAAVARARSSDSSALMSARVACPAVLGANRFAAQIPARLTAKLATAKTRTASVVTAIWCSPAMGMSSLGWTTAVLPCARLTRPIATHVDPSPRAMTIASTPSAV